MENSTHTVRLHGEGGKYFGILIVNLILTVLTLGLYYPWARAKNFEYLYGETEFAGSRFQFHGTGQEMFKGFIKALAILFVLGGIYRLSILSENATFIVVGAFIYSVGIFTIIPLAIHGGLRYRLSRTSWRGIHMGYRGNLRELFGIYFKGVLLTILTLGIYSSWFQINITRYLLQHVRLGNCKFSYEGDGSEYFWLNVKGFFLTIITFGIYSFWYAKDLNHYFYNNVRLDQDGEVSSLNSNLTAGDIFITGITNYFLIVFTLGIGTPWAILRQMRMTLNNLELVGPFNPDAVVQTEEDFSDATGDDMLDSLDIGLDF
jgi:uncharacterized membrane protein YjgN (DUF898 family)